MKKIIVLIAVVLFSAPVIAQENETFYFTTSEEIDYDEATDGFVPRHYLGDDLAVKMNMLRKQYTYKPEPTSMVPNPTTVVEKPHIYSSIKKLDRYYKKMLKKGKLSEEDVEEKLASFIEIGVAIRYQDTLELEEALKNVKVESEIENVFSRVQFK